MDRILYLDSLLISKWIWSLSVSISIISKLDFVAMFNIRSFNSSSTDKNHIIQ